MWHEISLVSQKHTLTHDFPQFSIVEDEPLRKDRANVWTCAFIKVTSNRVFLRPTTLWRKEAKKKNKKRLVMHCFPRAFFCQQAFCEWNRTFAYMQSVWFYIPTTYSAAPSSSSSCLSLWWWLLVVEAEQNRTEQRRKTISLQDMQQQPHPNSSSSLYKCMRNIRVLILALWVVG